MVTVGEVEPAGRRAVANLISQGICRSATYHSQTDSTNSLALDDLRSRPIAWDQLPRLYLADRQTAGRGRHGRSWHSNRGSLTFSIVIDWQLDLGRSSKLLSLGVGVGVARAIEFSYAPLRSRLKWPNDVYIDSGKVAGILIETTQSILQRVVIGVGVNVNETPDLAGQDDPGGQPVPVRSLAQVSGRQSDRYQLLEPLVQEILLSVESLRNCPSEVLGEFRSRCGLTGHRVTFRRGDQQHEGECLGVTDVGQLAIRTVGGVERLESGEARLLRIGKGH